MASDSGPTTNRRVMLAFVATSYRADAYVRAASELGVELVLVTDVTRAAQRFRLEAHHVDFAAVGQSVATLDLAPVDGVVATDERSAVLAATVAASPFCRGRYHSVAGVEAARDKRAMRECLLAAGVPQPNYRLLPPDAAAVDLAPGQFPCVVKPPMLSGSQGVIRADDTAALKIAAARVRRILDRHPSEQRRNAGFFELIVEDYVDGDEVAVEAVMRGGELELLAIFDKPDALCGPYFEETLYVTPSRKSPELQQQISEVARATAVALGLCDGPIHAELRLPASGPQLIEIAARSIGGLCSQALRHVVGGPLEVLLLRQALGEPPLQRPRGAPASGVMMIPVPRCGVLRRVSGLERARALPGVDSVQLTIAVGDAVRSLPEGASYLGFIFAHGDRPTDVEAALRAAHRALHFELKPLLAMM